MFLGLLWVAVVGLSFFIVAVCGFTFLALLVAAPLPSLVALVIMGLIVAAAWDRTKSITPEQFALADPREVRSNNQCTCTWVWGHDFLGITGHHPGCFVEYDAQRRSQTSLD